MAPARVLVSANQMSLFRSKRNKEPERFYLLPGQGGRAYRHKQRLILKWSIITALAVSAVFAVLMYWLDKPKL